MKGPSKGRAALFGSRQEWTARLDRFAEAKTPEEKQAIFEHAQQINPGGTIRSMLEAWGYSAAGRGRKKASNTKQGGKPARERLEDALHEIYGRWQPCKKPLSKAGRNGLRERARCRKDCRRLAHCLA